ncbi:hypothetical protein HQ403_03345, partial [Candidatus Kaiserbacteria bacterium]|nr:hypothetical protein [Candidatus Kaiserbacteria bacterium]
MDIQPTTNEQKNNTEVIDTAGVVTGSNVISGEVSNVNKGTYIIIFFGFIVVLAVLFTWFFFEKNDEVKDKTVNDVYGVNAPYLLQENNEVYQEARFARSINNYEKALPLYEQALSASTDPDERGQIKYEIALINDKINDEINAVRLLKEVIADNSVLAVLRASAVERMGRIYYTEHDNNVFNAIFSNKPYSDFLVIGDNRASLKNLFEYASSFYPLAYSELRIADWYADSLIINAAAGQSGGKSTEEIKLLIQEKINNADEDIKKLLEAYPNSSLVSTYLMRKAVVAGKLERLGDPILGSAEVLFNNAFNRGLIQHQGNSIGFISYNFAVFLSYNESKHNDVIKTLSIFYGDGEFTVESNKSPDFFKFLKNAKDDIDGPRGNIETLADID